MFRFLEFCYRQRATLLFIFLECISLFLLTFSHSSIGSDVYHVMASINGSRASFEQQVKYHFTLRDVNEQLAAENAALRAKLAMQEKTMSLPNQSKPSAQYIAARVLSNNLDQTKNFFTINRGKLDGVMPDMAVITEQGAVGKVRFVSSHFALVISLLNTDMQVSSMIKRTGNIGTAQWEGTNPNEINLKYIPSHVLPIYGDTIVTSGYNAVFPPGIPIGIIREVKAEGEAAFYRIRVELRQDFSKLNWVYVVNLPHKKELDSLQSKIQ